jgi:hypothetical protein
LLVSRLLVATSADASSVKFDGDASLRARSLHNCRNYLNFGLLFSP